MLERMFVADAEGVYDHLLDFTVPVTGTNFFAPSLDVLEGLADDPAGTPVADAVDGVAAAPPGGDETLGIGTLRGRGGL